MGADYYIRPMRPEDVAAAERLTEDVLGEVESRTGPREAPPTGPWNAARSASWRRRTEHVLGHDPGGCWVAEDTSGVVGLATSLRRDLTWVLASYVVRRDLQGRGVGTQLLDAALDHGSGCLRGMMVSSADPRATRRYRHAGFDLHPTMALSGLVARETLPVLDRVREGSPADVDLMDSIDRQVRDSAHGVDHEVLAASYRLIVVDRTTGSGYAYVETDGGPYLLAATNRRTATTLLWETLAASSPDVPCRVGRLTPGNQWAVDVGMAARLDLGHDGFLGLRGMRPPQPYLPSGMFL